MRLFGVSEWKGQSRRPFAVCGSRAMTSAADIALLRSAAMLEKKQGTSRQYWTSGTPHKQLKVDIDNMHHLVLQCASAKFGRLSHSGPQKHLASSSTIETHPCASSACLLVCKPRLRAPSTSRCNLRADYFPNYYVSRTANRSSLVVLPSLHAPILAAIPPRGTRMNPLRVSELH